MGKTFRTRLRKAALLSLLVFPGCAGFPWSGGGKEMALVSTLSPQEGAWAAASVLAMEVPTPCRRKLAPLVEAGSLSYLLEARARPGGLYRFRRGGRFRALTWVPLLSPGKDGSLERTLEGLEPQPLPATPWESTGERPFPSFYEAYLEVRVVPSGYGGCRITVIWKDLPGERIGERVIRHMEKALSILEPLAVGNDRFRAGDPIGALGAYDRALAAGRPPCCAFHAECLARIHFNRGLCLARMGDLEGALLAVERARTLDPGLPAADLLGETLGNLLDRRPGTGKKTNSPADLIEKGRRLLARGRLREAARVFQVARSKPGLMAAALQGLARVEMEQGRAGWARAHLLQALEWNPGNPSLLADLARLNQDQGEAAKALYQALPLGRKSPLFREILAAFPPSRTAPILTLLGKEGPVLPDSPLKRVLAAAGSGSSDPLSRIVRKVPSAGPASPPR